MTKQVDAHYVEEQARKIRDVAQGVMDAMKAGKRIDPYARNKVVSGGLAQDAAVLSNLVMLYEMGNE